MGTFAVILEKHAVGVPEDLLRLAKGCKEFMWYESNTDSCVFYLAQTIPFSTTIGGFLITGMSSVWNV